MKWFRIGLEAIGAASLLAISIVAMWSIYHNFQNGRRGRRCFSFSTGDVYHPSGFKIISRYQSRRNFTGDHPDCYCIELPIFEVAE